MKSVGFLLSILLIAESFGRETKMLVVLNRHGARYGYGLLVETKKQMQITQNGIRMGYLLGKYLRSKYPGFFPKTFVNRHNYLAASSPPRTQITAHAIMTGIYDKGSLDHKITVEERFFKPTFQDMNVKVDFDTPLPGGFQPFPIRATPVFENTMLNPYDGHVCPKIYFERIKQSNSYTDSLLAEINAFLPKMNTPKFDYQSISQTPTLTNYDQFDVISDYVTSLKFLGDDLGISPGIYNEMARLHSAQTYNTFFRDETLARFQFTELGRFMSKLITKFLNNSSKNPIRFALFSAHDLNLMNYLILTENFKTKCLGEEKPGPDDCTHVPPFASFIVWEIFEENNEMLVEAKFNGKPIKICGGKDICPATEFAEELVKLGLEGEYLDLEAEHCYDSNAKKNNYLTWVLGGNMVIIVGLVGAIWYLKRSMSGV